MGKRDDALVLLREGLAPPAIAAHQGVTLGTILGYLDQLIGRGCLRRSDVYFSMPRETREALAQIRAKVKEKLPEAEAWQVIRAAQSLGVPIDQDELEVVWHYGDPRNFLGDMYEDLALIEVTLHRKIRESLQSRHADAWWSGAVPAEVRQPCESFQARARRRAESPYQYTTLMNLHDIIKAQWQTLYGLFDQAFAADPASLLRDLRELNAIRNKVMHPVRGEAPNEDDFLFVRKLKGTLGIA